MFRECNCTREQLFPTTRRCPTEVLRKTKTTTTKLFWSCFTKILNASVPTRTNTSATYPPWENRVFFFSQHRVSFTITLVKRTGLGKTTIFAIVFQRQSRPNELSFCSRVSCRANGNLFDAYCRSETLGICVYAFIYSFSFPSKTETFIPVSDDDRSIFRSRHPEHRRNGRRPCTYLSYTGSV